MFHTQGWGRKKTYAPVHHTGTSLIQVDVSYAARGFRNVRTPTIIKVDVSYCKGRCTVITSPGRCEQPRNAPPLRRCSVVGSSATLRRCSVVEWNATPRRCRCRNNAATLQRCGVVGPTATPRRCVSAQRRGVECVRTTPRRCNVVGRP